MASKEVNKAIEKKLTEMGVPKEFIDSHIIIC